MSYDGVSSGNLVDPKNASHGHPTMLYKVNLLIQAFLNIELLILRIYYLLTHFIVKKIFPYAVQQKVGVLASFPCYCICPFLNSTVVEINWFFASLERDCVLPSSTGLEFNVINPYI